MAEDEKPFDMSQLSPVDPVAEDPETDTNDDQEIEGDQKVEAEAKETESSDDAKEHESSDDAKESDPEAPKWDKGLQKTQQRQAALESKLESLTGQIQQLLEQGVNSAKDKAKLEDLQDDANEIKDQLDPDDILTVAQATRLAQKAANEAVENYKKQSQAEREEADRNARQIEEANRKWVAEYDPAEPLLKGKGQEVLDEYLTEIAKTPSYARMSKQDQMVFLQDRLDIAQDRVLKRAAASAKTPARTPSAKPDKSPDGTRSVNPSVSNPKAADKGLSKYLQAMSRSS